LWLADFADGRKMATTTALSLSQIQQTSRYFDNLVNLIPAHHYFDPDEVISLRFTSKAERASRKAGFKLQHKQTKRAKLDPDCDRSTVALQHERNAGATASTSELPLVSMPATKRTLPCAHLLSECLVLSSSFFFFLLMIDDHVKKEYWHQVYRSLWCAAQSWFLRVGSGSLYLRMCWLFARRAFSAAYQGKEQRYITNYQESGNTSVNICGKWHPFGKIALLIKQDYLVSHCCFICFHRLQYLPSSLRQSRNGLL
jgi:hypothetical protein